MERTTKSYVIIERETARRVQRLAAWMALMLADAGPGWRRHERDLRLAAAEMDDAVRMADRISAAAAGRRVA